MTTIDMSLRYLLLNQLVSIQRAGYKVYGISAPGPNIGALVSAGIRHISVRMTRHFSPLSDIRSLLSLYKVMRNERFTIVHTHTPKPGLLGQLAARMAGVPVVVNTLHGFYFHDHMPLAWRRFYIAMERIAALCSDVILSQNSEDIETAVREGICSRSKVRHLGNGIDLERFTRSNLSSVLLEGKRRELGLATGQPVIGFVGRLVREKGLPELLEAAPQVLSSFPDARFLIIGPTDADKPDALTPATVAKYGVLDACIFTGMRNDMPTLYGLMDVFVLPSHREGFPRSPMEASAMQVPCIVTDVRGCRETVEHGQNGFLVPLGDVQAMADRIVQLISDCDLARRMGEEGHRIALERFDERQVFEKVKAEYARLLREKGIIASSTCFHGSAQTD